MPKFIREIATYIAVLILGAAVTFYAVPPKTVTKVVDQPKIEEPAGFEVAALQQCADFSVRYDLKCDGYKILDTYDRGENFPMPGTTYVVLTKHSGGTVVVGWLFHYDRDGILVDVE